MTATYRIRNFLLFCLISGLIPLTVEAQNAHSEADLKQINDAIARVEIRIDETTSRRSNVESELITTEQRLVDLNTRIRDIVGDINAQEQRLVELAERSDALSLR